MTRCDTNWSCAPKTRALQAHWLPVIGIAYDPAKDEMKSMLDGVDHLVFHPMEMYLDLGFGGVQSPGILDKDNAWQIVQLRDPLMVARPAAIT
jgi:hypothetical protein